MLVWPSHFPSLIKDILGQLVSVAKSNIINRMRYLPIVFVITCLGCGSRLPSEPAHVEGGWERVSPEGSHLLLFNTFETASREDWRSLYLNEYEKDQMLASLAGYEQIGGLVTYIMIGNLSFYAAGAWRMYTGSLGAAYDLYEIPDNISIKFNMDDNITLIIITGESHLHILTMIHMKCYMWKHMNPSLYLEGSAVA